MKTKETINLMKLLAGPSPQVSLSLGQACSGLDLLGRRLVSLLLLVVLAVELLNVHLVVKVVNVFIRLNCT